MSSTTPPRGVNRVTRQDGTPSIKKGPNSGSYRRLGLDMPLYECYVITTATKQDERGLETHLKPPVKFFFLFLSFFLNTNMNFSLNRLREPIQPTPTPRTPPRHPKRSFGCSRRVSNTQVSFFPLFLPFFDTNVYFLLNRLLEPIPYQQHHHLDVSTTSTRQDGTPTVQKKAQTTVHTVIWASIYPLRVLRHHDGHKTRRTGARDASQAPR